MAFKMVRSIYDISHLDVLSLLNRPGHCILTVGTDTKAAGNIKGLRLLPLHNYAVIGKLGHSCSTPSINVSQISRNHAGNDG